MLGTPTGGSELADLMLRWRLYRAVFGPAGQQLATAQSRDLRAALGSVDYELGILAGDRPCNPLAAGLVFPGPNDGKVTVASTRLAGMANHRVVHASHTRLLSQPDAIAATLRFLCRGSFGTAP